MLRWLLLAHGLTLATGLRVNEPASLAGEYEDTPADFAPANYEVTALGVLAASCPCEWATDSSPIHKGWLWDRILIVDDDVCGNSCTAPVAACAAQLANASGLLVTERYNPSKQLEGRLPLPEGDFAASDPSINATCHGRPVYQQGGVAGGDILFQPSLPGISGTSDWEVSDTEQLRDCAATGYLDSDGGGASCPASPSGAGCAGRWKEDTHNCGVGSIWCPSPNVTVAATFDASGCDASPDCGHGRCVVEGGGRHSCACEDGYSGPKCQ